MSGKSDSDYYFGVQCKEHGGIEFVTALKMARGLDAFNKIDDENEVSAGKEEQEAPAREEIVNRGFLTIGRELFNSLLGFRDVLQTAGIAYNLLQTVEIKRFVDTDLKACSTECDDVCGWRIRRIESHAVTRTTRAATRLIRQLEHHAAMDNVFLLGLVSQFDAFFGSLIRELAIYKPHIVLNSDKSYTAAEIMKFSDISRFQEAVLERETESVLRKSHSDQFKWLEEKLDKRLRDIDVWPEFIEICERRNLFAHTSGIVSNTYIQKCREQGKDVDCVVGDALSANSDYLMRAAEVFLEISVKLTQVIWRVVQDSPEENSKANSQLNSFAYELILHGSYGLAEELLEFGMSKPMKHPNKTVFHMMQVNLANAYKLGGKKTESDAVLASEDWEALHPQFQVCVAGIREDMDDLKRLVPLVPEADIGPGDYFDWPVFRGVVENDEYVRLIREQFGDDAVALLWKNGPQVSGDKSSRLTAD